VTEAQAARQVNLTTSTLKCLRRMVELEDRFGRGHRLALQSGSQPSALSNFRYTEVAFRGRGGVCVYRVTDTGRAALKVVARLLGS
jgi:hypothetical protein